MEPLTILLLAFALAMDAFAVSIASGVHLRDNCYSNGLRIGIAFGSFQAFMPVVGYLIGSTFEVYVEAVDHWIAFALLVGIGLRMVHGSKSEVRGFDCTRLEVLLLLSFATSIDALAVGLTFAFVAGSILVPVIIIGAVAFILSFTGVVIGSKLGHLFENRLEVIGGLILIGIGFEILVSQLGII